MNPSADPEHGAGPVRQLLALLPMTALWALVAQGILSVTRLLTSMTVGGKFSQAADLGADTKLITQATEQLGYYLIGFSVLMMVVALFEAFITTPLTVFNQKYTTEQRPKFSGRIMTVGLMLIGVIICVTACLIAVQYQTEYLNPGLAIALIAAALMIPFQLLREFSRRWLLANLQAMESAILEIVFAVLFLVGVSFLLLTNHVSAAWMFTTLAIVNAIGVAGWWLVFRNQFDFSKQPADPPLRTQISENAKYGGWVAGENVCGVLTMYFCTWFIAYYMQSEEATGVFGACFLVVMLANPFLLGIASILAPKAAEAFSEGGYPEMLKVLIKFGFVLFTVMTLLSLLLWFAGDQITKILYPTSQMYFIENFGGQNQITAVLGLALPAMGLSYLASCGLLAAHRPRDNFYSAIVGVIVLVAINFSFPETTLMTASMSFILSFCVATACRLVFLVRAFLLNLQPN